MQINKNDCQYSCTLAMVFFMVIAINIWYS